MKRYKITLKPTAPFFFGGEYTFGADEARNEVSRYRAVSTYFPQQSAVLGMLRKTLLIENGCMSMHKKGEWVDSRGRQHGNNPNYDKAVELAGSRSFDYLDPTDDLGIIRSISPLMIEKGGVTYLPAPLDDGVTPRVDETIKIRIRKGRTQPAILFDDFDPKKGIQSGLLGSDGSRLDFDRVFKKVQSVGIKKSRSGKTLEKAFFIKESFTLNEATFVFYAEFDEDPGLNKSYVTLGADASPFVLVAEPCEEDPLQTIASHVDAKPVARVIALSELLIRELPQEALFVLGRRRRHRTIVASEPGKFAKSVPFHLLDAGSVIYTHDPVKLCDALTNTELERAGVNRLIIKEAKGENK